MKKSFIIIALLAMVIGLDAQIGYQVSLLNTATGEPRANENVEVIIEITDSEGTSICKETKNATTNDFGVLSLQVGNATTFENANWSKLPFYVSATVDDILVGKSQILNVPVAEAAKTLVGSVSKSDIVGTWNIKNFEIPPGESFTFTFEEDNTFNIIWLCIGETGIKICVEFGGFYNIVGNIIYLISEEKGLGLSYYNKEKKEIMVQFLDMEFMKFQK